MAGEQRLCRSCGQVRKARQAEEERASNRSAVDAVINSIKERPDPIERLLRVAWFMDKYEGRADAWEVVSPGYPRGHWDSPVVGRRFAAKAEALSVKPGRRLQTYIARPASQLVLLLGMPGYVPGPEIPCWSFEEGSTETRTVTPDCRMSDTLAMPYTVAEWAYVLRDGSVVIYESAPGKPRSGPRPRIDVCGTEKLRPTGLNENALIQMAVVLGMTDQRPGLKVKHKPLTYGHRGLF